MPLEPIDSLIPHPDNARRSNIGLIEELIRTNGFVGAIIAQVSTRHILVGNGRWRAARNVGLSEIPVIWHNCSDAEALRVLAADNRASDLATYNKVELLAVLDQLEAADNLHGSGYTPLDVQKIEAELNAMFAPVEPKEPQGPSAQGKPERTVLLRIGTVSAKVPQDRWTAWQDALYVRIGHKRGSIVDEIRRRLKI
jgi:ParB-like chromosome segregation protein Spo0J